VASKKASKPSVGARVVDKSFDKIDNPAPVAVPVEPSEEECVLRGDRYPTITETAWRLLMAGRIEISYEPSSDGRYDFHAVPPVVKNSEKESPGTGYSMGYSKSKVKVSLADPRACTNCGDKASPLHPSGECDSCLQDRLSLEMSE
jgi:hypothetical protein